MEDLVNEDIVFDVDEITETGTFGCGLLEECDKLFEDELIEEQIQNIPLEMADQDDANNENLNNIAIEQVYGEEDDDTSSQEQLNDRGGSIFQQFPDILHIETQQPLVSYRFDTSKTEIITSLTNKEQPSTEQSTQNNMQQEFRNQEKNIKFQIGKPVTDSTDSVTSLGQPLFETSYIDNIKQQSESTQPANETDFIDFSQRRSVKHRSSNDEEISDKFNIKNLDNQGYNDFVVVPQKVQCNDDFVVVEDIATMADIFNTSANEVVQRPEKKLWQQRLVQSVRLPDNKLDITRQSVQVLTQSVILSKEDNLTEEFNNTHQNIYYPTYDPKGAGEFKVSKNYNQYIKFLTVEEQKTKDDQFEYRIFGTDPNSNFLIDINRKLRHFQILRACLVLKFPALYIPLLPKKKISEKSQDSMLRLFLLNRFINQIYMCAYLLESQELKTFLNQTADVEPQLMVIMQSYQQNTTQHLSAIEQYYFIQGTFTDHQIDCASAEIKEFQAGSRRMQTFLSKLINIVTDNEKKYEKNNERIRSLNKFLYEFEVQSVQSYSHIQNVDKQKYLLFENPQNELMKQNFDQYLTKKQNPFTFIRHWLSFETLQVQAQIEAIETRDNIDRMLQNKIKKYQDNSELLQKLQQGEITLKSFYKNKEAIQKNIELLLVSLPCQEVDIANLSLHANIVNLYLVREAIPFFKKGKFSEFFQNVNSVSAREITHHDQTVKMFQEIIGVNTEIIKDNVMYWQEFEADGESRIIHFEDDKNIEDDF